MISKVCFDFSIIMCQSNFECELYIGMSVACTNNILSGPSDYGSSQSVLS